MATEANMGRVNEILNLPSEKDRIEQLGEQIKSLCKYFDTEHRNFKTELDQLKSVILNRPLTPKEASQILKIKEGGVRKNLEIGKLKGYKEGGRWRTTLQYIHEYMQSKPNRYSNQFSILEMTNFLK